MFESFRTLVRFAPGYDVADLQPAIYSLVMLPLTWLRVEYQIISSTVKQFNS